MPAIVAPGAKVPVPECNARPITPRPSGTPGGDFASGCYKGQCAPGEYVAGVAYTGRVGSSRTPDALLCRV
ncbi:hypothetical protein [Amycolatopsis sp. lyj-108]|uniref:hypothetical protein n=1 Tax=Amycolatopsis sp. lyj-108 TaxID=2789286 RepID=UPI00397AA364